MGVNKSIRDLELKLRIEKASTKAFSDALNEERLRHGATERKLDRANEVIRKAHKNGCVRDAAGIPCRFCNYEKEIEKGEKEC